MKCVTGKIHYPYKEVAEEALVAHRGRNHFRENSGPIAVYQCDDCGGWHFTSKGPKSSLLDRDDIQDQIKNDQEAEFWRNKFR